MKKYRKLTEKHKRNIGTAKKKYFFDKQELCNLHFVQGKTIQEIAEIHHCGHATISIFLKNNGIKTLRWSQTKIIRNKNNLDINNVSPKLEKNIKASELKYVGNFKNVIDILNIINLYVDKKLSVVMIAKMYNCDKSCIESLIFNNNIPKNIGYRRSMPDESGTKICPICMKTKLLEEFPISKKTKLGIVYRKKCKVCYNKQRCIRQKWRRENDINFRLQWYIRTSINTILKENNVKRSIHSIKLLGCSICKLKKYFKSLFTEGMTWEKFLNGEIHIDHVIPLSYFDLSSYGEFQIANKYENLQPLWAEDNLKKHNKIDGNDWKASRVLQWLSYYRMHYWGHKILNVRQ